MNAGLIKALSGCVAQEKRLQAVSDNLSHIQQTGYKQKRIGFSQKSFSDIADQTRIDQTQGSLKKTGNPLDIGIQGEGFFTIQTPHGIAYTRKGSFTRGSNSELLTQDGNKVLGEGGPIILNGNQIAINSDGTVVVDNNIVDTLRIAVFDDPTSIQKITPSLFQTTNPALERKATGYIVNQGQLELSNVNMMKEMVRMIEITRTFESCQKVIQSFDSITGMAVNQVGR